MRDPVLNSLLEHILVKEKPKGIHALSWAKFKLTSATLFFTGLRINEVAIVTETMVLEMIKKGQMTFYQPKVNKHRVILLSKHAIRTIKQAFNDNRTVLFSDNDMIYPGLDRTGRNVEKFITSFNKLLKMCNEDKTKKLTSHSFRVGFVSNALDYTSAHDTQLMVGHSDIRSTMKYSRYKLDLDRHRSILERMFPEEK